MAMTSIKKFVDVGDLAAPIESQDWCRAVHHGLRITSRQTDKEVRQLKYAMLEFRNKERWKKLVDNRDKPFRSWEQYVSYPEPNGLGLPVESVDAIIRALDNELIGQVMGKHGGDRRSKAAKDQAYNQAYIVNLKSKGGNRQSLL
jgi:hypothetical protein